MKYYLYVIVTWKAICTRRSLYINHITTISFSSR